MSDALNDGRNIRTFNVIDDYNREGLGVDSSLPSARIIRSLEQIIAWRGRPLAIRSDNGPEYISQHLKDWATRHPTLCCIFNQASPLKMRISNDLTEPLDTNG
jgi:putative transposase